MCPHEMVSMLSQRQFLMEYLAYIDWINEWLQVKQVGNSIQINFPGGTLAFAKKQNMLQGRSSWWKPILVKHDSKQAADLLHRTFALLLLQVKCQNNGLLYFLAFLILTTSYLVLSNSNSLSLCLIAFSRPDLNCNSWWGRRSLVEMSTFPEFSVPEIQ